MSLSLSRIRHEGISIGGDETYYLVEAISLGRFHTVDLKPGFEYAYKHHQVYPWTVLPGQSLIKVSAQGNPIYGHGMLLPGHAIGLSALLAIPMRWGTRPAAFALIVVLAVLAVWLFHLVGEVSGVRRSPWRFAVIGLVLAPAYLLANIQFYPDLISGLIMAASIMFMVLVETKKKHSWLQLLLVSLTMMLFPWLDQKNILLTILFIAAFIVFYLRKKLDLRRFCWLILPVTLSLVCLVVFNLWAFGHVLGVNQGVSLFSGNTITRFIALLFDSRQGLFIQLPTALLGLVGIWIFRRRAPIAAVFSVLVILATVYGNATQLNNFGGGSFVGRFQWPVSPILLAFAGLYLLVLHKTSPFRAYVIAVAVACLYVIQAIPFALDEHIYFNQIAWDPSVYRGWWGRLDPSPILGYSGGMTVFNVPKPSTNVLNGVLGFAHTPNNPWTNMRVIWGLSTIALSGSAAIVYLTMAVKKVKMPRIAILSLVGLAIVTYGLTLHSPVLLPPPLTFQATSFTSEVKAVGSSVIAKGSLEDGLIAADGPEWILSPGSYEFTVNYKLSDKNINASPVSVDELTRSQTAGLITLDRGALSGKTNNMTFPFKVKYTETVSIDIKWDGSGSLRLNKFTLVKKSSLK
jgi:hypothetical protein